MAESKPLILMIHSVHLQSIIWQTVFKSQRISVIQESPDTDLSTNLEQLKEAGLILPSLLIVDINNIGFNPYSFCRWCREHHPNLKVILINSQQLDISPPERQWAINQGAAELLPGFNLENLVSSVTNGIKSVLSVLDNQELDNGALIAVLLKMKRELDARRIKATEMSTIQPSQNEKPGQFSNDNSSLKSSPDWSKPYSEFYPNGQSPTPSQSPEQPSPSPEPQKPRRRYRGIAY
jgi:hypothetical protein